MSDETKVTTENRPCKKFIHPPIQTITRLLDYDGTAVRPERPSHPAAGFA